VARDLILEPFAARLRWVALEPKTAEGWESLLAEFTERVARRCTVAGARVIGHVKGFAFGPGDGYLNVSVVSAERGELELTLNVLVYGLSRLEIQGLVGEVAVDQGVRSRCAVTVEGTGAGGRFADTHVAEPSPALARAP
jgi:hypothetical protein